MTLRDVGAGVVYLGAIAGALVAIGAVMHVVVVVPLRRWIRAEVSEVLARHIDQDHKDR